MTNSGPTVGLYGKLPCNGDFLHRRVPLEFVEVWDGWIRESLIQSRLRLQERWREAYLTSPVWRFVLAPGLCGSGMYAGVMLPSVDRVGRCFPLAIVARWDMEVSQLQTAFNQQRWFDFSTALALGALGARNLSFEDFDRDVARSAAHLIAGGDRPASPDPLDRRTLEQGRLPPSFWWSGSFAGPNSNMLCARGLPDPGGFAVMWPQRRSHVA